MEWSFVNNKCGQTMDVKIDNIMNTVILTQIARFC